MFFIQERQAEGNWERRGGFYKTVLDALEKRDEFYRDKDNSKFWKQWRVVDENGTIYDYKTATV